MMSRIGRIVTGRGMAFGLAAAIAMAFSSSAKAGFTYISDISVVDPDGGSLSGGTGQQGSPITVTFGGDHFVVLEGNTDNTVNTTPTGMSLGKFALSSTSTTPIAVTLGLNFAVTIFDTVFGTGTGNVTFDLVLTNFTSGSAVQIASSFTNLPVTITTSGGAVYTLNNGTFSQATPNDTTQQGFGSFGLQASAAVPEPASMAMLAMGGLGLLGAARRRKAQA